MTARRARLVGGRGKGDRLAFVAGRLPQPGRQVTGKEGRIGGRRHDRLGAQSAAAQSSPASTPASGPG